MDGGVRRGTDVLKAIALGAKAVLLGRPILWGLAVEGEQGAVEVLNLIKGEFNLALALSGYGYINEIDKSLIYKNNSL